MIKKSSFIESCLSDSSINLGLLLWILLKSSLKSSCLKEKVIRFSNIRLKDSISSPCCCAEFACIIVFIDFASFNKFSEFCPCDCDALFFLPFSISSIAFLNSFSIIFFCSLKSSRFIFCFNSSFSFFASSYCF